MSSPTTWWKVPPRSSTRVRWRASSLGEAAVSPSLREMYTAMTWPPAPFPASRTARRIRVRPSGPPVRPTTIRSREPQTAETWCSLRYSVR